MIIFDDSILRESVFDDIGLTVISRFQWPDNANKVEDLDRAIQQQQAQSGDLSPILFDVDGEDAYVGEGSIVDGIMTFVLVDGVAKQYAKWLRQSTEQEVNHMMQTPFVFVKGNDMLKIVDVSSCKINLPDSAADGMSNVIRVKLTKTGRQEDVKTEVDGRPSTAREFIDAFRSFGKNGKDMPQVWLADGIAAVPNFAMKKGNFAMVHLVDLDELAFDEKHDAAEAIHLLSTVPQDLEMVIQFGGDSYEIDKMEVIPGKGLKVELRPWGEIDEAAEADEISRLCESLGPRLFM